MTHPDLQRATGPAAPALDVVTRIGFGAKGIVTILVGVLALRFALRRGGEITGQEGAVELVLREPFGRLMLAVLAAGLAAYALWMFVAAFVDPERKGESFQGIAERLGFFATGIGYTLLALTALNLLLGRKGGGGLDLQHVLATVLTPHVGRVPRRTRGPDRHDGGRAPASARRHRPVSAAPAVRPVETRATRDERQWKGRVRDPRHPLTDRRLVPRGGGGRVRPVGGERMVGGALAAVGRWAGAGCCSPRRRSA